MKDTREMVTDISYFIPVFSPDPRWLDLSVGGGGKESSEAFRIIYLKATQQQDVTLNQVELQCLYSSQWRNSAAMQLIDVFLIVFRLCYIWMY